MIKRHLPWICATCCSLGSTAVFGCGAPETLLGTHRYAVGDTPVLVRIDQNGSDLLIAVDNAAGTSFYNSPSDRSGFELVYLQPEQGSTQDICVHSTFRNPDIRTPYTLSEIDVAANEYAALQRFSAASGLWARVEATARNAALSEYVALAAQADFRYRDEARLHAVRGELVMIRPESALRLLADFEPRAELTARAPHLVPWYRGAALMRENDFEAAVLALTEAAQLSPLPLDTAEIRNHLGEALVTLDRIDAGEAQLQEAIRLSGADHSMLARVHNNLGYVQLRRAFSPTLTTSEVDRWLRASIDEHLVARAFAVNAGDAAEKQLIDNNLGTLYDRMRELRKAHYHYREALSLAGAADNPYTMHALYMNLGGLNLKLGDYPKARSYLEQSLQVASQIDSPIARVNCLLGTAMRMLGELEQALAIHETCRRLAAESADYPGLIEAMEELSEDYLVAARAPGAAEEQLAAARSAIAIARALVYERLSGVLAPGPIVADPRTSNLCSAPRVNTAAESATLSERQILFAGDVLSRHALLAQDDSALADLNLAAGVIGDTRYTGKLRILDAAMRVYHREGNDEFARVCGELALDLSERLHEDLEAERNGPAWTAKTHEIYVGMADMLLDQSRRADDAAAHEAFAVAERAMGISLRQHLSLPPEDSHAREDKRLRTLLNTLADQHAALSAEQKAALLPVSYYHQHDLLELSRLRDQERVAIPPALRADEVQQRLRPAQTVLYYYIGADDAWLFTLDRTSFQTRRLGSAARLTQLLAAVEQDLRATNGAPLVGLRDLSAFLLPETLQLNATKELLIVPHRDLYKIPFAALVRAQSDDYRPLIEDVAVSTTPSLTAYFMDKPGSSAAHATDIAVFADPVFNSADLRSEAADLAVADAALQTWSASLERLPYTELEANSLKALFQPERTLDFLGNRATLENLASAPARNARILHIATHGYFHSTSSDNVGLVLSAINERNERVPGFVTLTELFGHRFNNELVVISGCDTAMGMQLAGEGMMGLTRGFLAQGARHVISTLWPVSDRASAQFMTLFYANLRRVGSVTEALRAAQAELKALPEYRHPYYWAPYVLTTVSPADTMSFGADLALTR